MHPTTGSKRMKHQHPTLDPVPDFRGCLMRHGFGAISRHCEDGPQYVWSSANKHFSPLSVGCQGRRMFNIWASQG